LFVLYFEDDSQAAVIQIASSGTDSKRSVTSEFKGMQGKKLTLLAAESLPISTPVSVNYNDAMFLGEIISCTEKAALSWQVEIKVEQILTGLQDLLSLRNSLLGEAVAKPLRMVPIGARN
jgi:hypothetical protein